ncbi:MAG TPA: ferritin family protein [Bacteroidales bacterium]|nr:ferritin family protein [Bacteroidales bacterium]HPS16457.1 ferritin family protein [Bacteroidales bacterium]
MKEFENIQDILTFAINQEQEAVDFYNDLSSRSVNREMKEIFQQFAREEMQHKAKLLAIEEQGFFDNSIEKIIDLKISDYIVQVHYTPQMTYQDALVLAMKKEKSAFKLYYNLSEKAPNAELKNLFLMLAQEESKHKLRFEIEYDEYVLKEN